MLTQPVFFAACNGDIISSNSRMVPTLQSVAKDLTVAEYDAGHWVYYEYPDQLNEALNKWLEAKVSARSS